MRWEALSIIIIQINNSNIQALDRLLLMHLHLGVSLPPFFFFLHDFALASLFYAPLPLLELRNVLLLESEDLFL